MKTLLPDQKNVHDAQGAQDARIAREVARERHQRELNDAQRSGLALDEEFRVKDARESINSTKLRRTR